LEIKPEELAERNRILSSILRKNALNFGNIFSVLVTIFNFENFMRVHLTVMQALGAGMSAVNIVLQAIKAYPKREV
jgi:hypothetical protein